MANTTLSSVWDDGKGREKKLLEPPKIDNISIKKVEDWSEVKSPGDYSYISLFEGYKSLVMICPFCGLEAPMPLLVTIEEEEPLSIQQELNCGRCTTSFHIIKGTAIRSWFPGGITCIRPK